VRVDAFGQVSGARGRRR